MDWKIIREEEGGKGRFLIVSEGRELGKMTYVYAGKDKVIIDHTEVSDELKGQGAGKKLVDAGAKWARDEGIKIIPLCPFAKSVMDRFPEEYADVLA